MLGSFALGLGAIITGGIGYRIKSSTADFEKKVDEIERDDLVPIRHAVHAMRAHLKEGGDTNRVYGRFSVEGYSWAPRSDAVVRDSGDPEHPHRYVLLRTPETSDGAGVAKQKNVDNSGREIAASEHVASKKHPDSLHGRALCLIDRTSFERTGLGPTGNGNISPEELERRRKVIANFSYEDLDLLEPEAQEQREQDIEDRGFFINLVPGLGDKIFGKSKSNDDILGPLFWAVPSEERPNDPIEKRAGGVWLKVETSDVPDELFVETSTFAQARTDVSAGSVPQPPGPRVSGHKGAEAAIPFGTRLFVHGRMSLTSEGEFTLTKPTVITTMTKEQYVASCRSRSAKADLVGTSLFGLSGALAAGAVVTAVRALNPSSKE